MEIDIKALESAIADAINHPSELLGVCLTVKEAQAVLALLKEQKQFFVDENGKITPFPVVVRCKDCDNRECDGRAGTIVCGITGESHSRLWFCADGKRKET